MNVTVSATPTRLIITRRDGTKLNISGPAQTTILQIITRGPKGADGDATTDNTNYKMYYDLSKG